MRGVFVFSMITGGSVKLRPYIKRSKPEKKEKIEEELRKIKVGSWGVPS